MNIDRNNPSSSSSSTAVENHTHRNRRYVVEEESGDPVACTGKSCQSCTAEVIADCVAVCCCPCAVVNFFALAFFKLPYALARKLIGCRKKNSRRRMMLEGGRNEILEKGGAEMGTSEIVVSTSNIRGEEVVNDNFSAEFKAEDVWLELYEVGHLGFGRVSFTGFPFQNKGN